MNITDVMLVYLDPDFNFVWVNQAYADTCRMAPEDMIGKNHFVLYPNAANESIFCKVRSTGQSVFYKDKPFEFYDQPERGITYWDWSLAADKNQSGQVTGLVFSLRETTKYVQAREASKANEEQLSFIYANIHDIVFVVDVEPNGQFRFASVNYGFERATGLQMAQVIGKLVQEVIPESSHTLVLEKYREAIRYMKPVHWEEVSIYPTGEKIADMVVTPAFVKGEQRLQLIGVAHDITERKKAEEELRLMQFSIDNSPDAVYRMTPDGRFLYVNRMACHTLGYSAEELLNMSVADIDPNLPFGVSPEMARATKDAKTAIVESEHKTKDGRIIPVEILVSHIEYAGREYHCAFVRDISERKQVDQALKASIRNLEGKEQAKSRFLAAAGHDLRQPLAAANLFIDALKYTTPSPEQGQIIARLDMSMSNFSQLLDALLNVSKLESGTVKPEFMPIDVASILGWLEDIYSPIATEKGLRFDMYFPAGKALVVRSDINLLKSVLSNLVVNAIKYTEKGEVLVSARQRGEHVLFQVWDTGIGIQDENIEKIFDDFYQVDNQQRDREQGLGLGLSIVKRALALIDDGISCRSKVGRGSVFEFKLPMETRMSGDTTQSALSIPESVESEDNSAFVKGKRFVVVEDDAMVSEAMCRALTLMGGEVKCFHIAEDALRHPDIGKADYYIVDYMLPGNMSGLSFLQQLQSQSDRPVCGVLISGNTSTDFIRGAEMYDWPVIHKPVNMTKLLARLKKRKDNIG